jgi:hypothetical protein
MNQFWLLSGVIFLLLITSFFNLSCSTNLKQEVPSGNYGRIVETFPDMPETKEPLPHPDYVELRYMK